MTRRRSRFNSPHQQRGAVAVFAAITLTALIISALIVIEIGRLYAAQRQLEKLATIAALDAVRVVGSCDRIDPPAYDDVAAEVLASIGRNVVGNPEQFLGTGSLIALGEENSEDGLRVLDTGVEEEDASAIGVTLTRPTPAPLAPLLLAGGGSKTMTATAYAGQSVVGRISVGTRLLGLNTEDSALLNGLLGGLLGTNINLTAVDYNGLANADVTLLELAQVGAGVGAVGDLLDLQVGLPGALQIIGDALHDTGEGADQTAGNLLDTLAGVADPQRDVFDFGELINIEDGAENLVGALPVNALDLLLGLAQVANQGYRVDLPLSGLVNIPGVASIDAFVRIGQAPQIALGRPGYKADGTPRTQARSAQIAIELDVGVLDLLSALPLAGSALLNVEAIVEVAPGTAILERVRCIRGDQPQHEAVVKATTGAAKIALGRYNNPALPNPTIVTPNPLLSVPVLLGIGFTGPVIVSSSTSNDTLDFEGPFPDKVPFDPDQHTQRVGDSAGPALDGLTGDLLSQLGGKLQFTGVLGGVLNALGAGALLGLLDDLLAPLLQLLDLIIGTQLELLGISLGGADVSVKSLTIEQPAIFSKSKTTD